MQGRIEHELQINNRIDNLLKELPDYVAEWNYNLKASDKTAASISDYIYKIKKFLEYIDSDVKNIKPEDITLLVVQQYFISIQTKIDKDGEMKYTSDSYRQTVWCCLNSFLEYMYNTDRIPKNYMNLIDKPKNRDGERIKEHRVLLTKKDFNKILDSVRNGAGSHKAMAFQKHTQSRDMAIMVLFMTTGMRKTALSEINMEDVDLISQKVRIIDKGDKHHEYDLSDEVCECLEDWLEDREEITNNKKVDALFISSECGRLSQSAITKLVKKYTEDALGNSLSPHKLRSGYCSILYKETGNIEFVRRAVGHSNISTTQRYITTPNEEKKKASSLMSNVLKI